MSKEAKGALIWQVINALNEKIRKENKRLCERNLYSEQKPLHGADMFFTLSFMDDDDFNKIVRECGF